MSFFTIEPAADGHKNNPQTQSENSQANQPRQFAKSFGKNNFGKSMGNQNFGKSMHGQAPTLQERFGNSSQLDKTVQAKMENSFGTSFSDVNVHKDSPEATSMGAKAFTQGTDVHFAPGQYNPGSSAGQELIGHELTHVVEQKQGRVKATAQAKGAPVNDDPALEKEADEMGRKASQGEVTKVNGTGSGVQLKKGPHNGKNVDKDTGKLTDKEREAIKAATVSRMDQCVGRYSSAIGRAYTDLQIQKISKKNPQLLSIVIELGFAFISPTIGKFISEAVNRIPNNWSNTAYSLALVAQNPSIMSPLLSTASANGKNYVDSEFKKTSEFDEKGTFLEKMETAMHLNIQSLTDKQTLWTDKEMMGYFAFFDARVTSSINFFNHIKIILAKFQKEIVPIGKKARKSDFNNITRSENIVAQIGSKYALVEKTEKTGYSYSMGVSGASGGGIGKTNIKYRLITWISQEMENEALNRVENPVALKITDVTE